MIVLRFVSAFFLRGALFLVDEKKGDISGSGGFGLGVADPGRLVHSIHLPLQADTVFSRCLKERAGVRQLFYDSEWNLRLVQALGGPRPRDVYTAPLISPRGIEGVLYADNATDPRPFPDIHLMEIFLQQAAAALERATLSRQLKQNAMLSSARAELRGRGLCREVGTGTLMATRARGRLLRLPTELHPWRRRFSKTFPLRPISTRAIARCTPN